MIDANTVVSAALKPGSVPREAILMARLRGVIALSDAVFAEITEVLARPKFRRVLSDDRRLEIIELLSVAAVWFDPVIAVQDCRDAKDNRYLELALAAGAQAIVTGDDDLLLLDPWRGIRVLRPADFTAALPFA